MPPWKTAIAFSLVSKSFPSSAVVLYSLDKAGLCVLGNSSGNFVEGEWVGSASAEMKAVVVWMLVHLQ